MAMSTEDRLAAASAKKAAAAATAANGGIDPGLTRQYGITDPDLAKLLQMWSMPATIAWGDPSMGGSRAQEQAAAKAAQQFAALGGQAELDRLKAKVAADPALSSQLNAVIAAGNKGDIFSKIGDAVVSATPLALQIAAVAAGADIISGGSLFAGGAATEATAALPAGGMVGTGAVSAAESALMGAGTGTGVMAGTDAAISAGLAGTTTAGSMTAAAVDAGLAAAGDVAATGGAFVGTAGALGSTGNSVVDGALNSALSSASKNAAVNVLTGNDPLANADKSLLGGAAFGAVNAAVPDSINLTGNKVLDASISGAANTALPAGAAAVATGGDVGNALTGGTLIGAGVPLINSGVNAVSGAATSAVNAVVPDSINPNIRQSTVSDVLGSTATGALVGGVQAGVNGGDIGSGVVVGGLGGLGGSLAGQAVDSLFGYDKGSIGNTLANSVGTVAGQIIGNELAPPSPPATLPAADPVYSNTPGTMSTIGSVFNPNYAGGLINNYQSLAVKRANQARA